MYYDPTFPLTDILTFLCPLWCTLTSLPIPTVPNRLVLVGDHLQKEEGRERGRERETKNRNIHLDRH